MIDDPREDSAIIIRVLEGEVHLFGVLVGRYERLMYSFLLPQVRSFQEVQDISQDVFFKAYRHLSTFDQKRKFSSWVLKIARNVLIDRFRKITEIVGPQGGSIQEIMEKKSSTDPQDTPDKKHEVQEEFKKTFVNMLQLPDELKIPLLLRVLQDLTYEEISEILDVPVQTIKNRIFRARQTLRDKRNSENAV